MYIRWNRKKRIKKIEWVMKEGDYIYAVLVENIRIDGKPRQKTIKYLSGIGENNPSVYSRMMFWEKAEKNLASLNLAPDVQEKILASLRERVPKPSDEEFSAWREIRSQRLKELEGKIAKSHR